MTNSFKILKGGWERGNGRDDCSPQSPPTPGQSPLRYPSSLEMGVSPSPLSGFCRLLGANGPWPPAPQRHGLT